MAKKAIIHSFGRQLLKLLVEGSKRRIELPFPSYKKAVAFRARAYALRRAMLTQNHALGNIVALTKITVEWDHTLPQVFNSKNVPRPTDTNIPATLIVQPNDSEYNDILTAGGIDVDDLKTDPLDVVAPPPIFEKEPLDDDMKSILDKYKPEDEKKS